VSVGVVGAGRMGGLHAAVYGRLPAARLVAIVDTVSERAQRLAAETGAEALTDVHQLIGRVDAASVAVSTSAHLEVGRALLEAGVHVLIEKPLAATADEARELVEVARKSGAQLMVGHTERFNPVMRGIGDLVRQPGFVEVHRLAPFTDRGTDVDVVLDLMIHDLDLLLQFVPGEPVEVHAVGVSVLTGSYDIANARIRFAGGTVANLTASRVSLERMRKVRFFEPDLYVSLDTGKRTAKAFRLVQKDSGPSIEVVDLAPPPDEDPMEVELSAFLESVRSGVAPPVPGEHGLRAMELAERVCAAIEADARETGR